MALARHIVDAFVARDRIHREVVVRAVSRAGFSITWIESDFSDPASWGMVLKPNYRLSRMFRLDREVLLWCTTFNNFQVRDIANMKRFMDSMSGRVTRSFSILVSKYSPESRSTFETESEMETTIVHCSVKDLAEAKTLGDPTLVIELWKKLYTRDLYDLPVATTQGSDFFGRRSMLDDISDEIALGNSQIGVFGLRKVGKTSLVNRVADLVVQSGRCLVARLDLQWTTSINPSAEYTLWALGESIRDSGRAARSIKGFRLFGRYSVYSDISQGNEDVWELFAHDMNLLIPSLGRRRVAIFIDEIERIYEVSQGREFVRLWRLLRGLDQQHPGKLRYLVSGTSPECVEQAFVNAEDNPLYQYFSMRYLGPLEQKDTDELLSVLGEQIGLHWREEGLRYAFEQTGGHPALVRALGSTIHSSLVDRSDIVAIDHSQARRAARVIVSTRSAVLAQIKASLEDRYQDEFLLLQMLADGDIHDFQELARSYPEEMSHLIGYGLLPAGDQSTSLTISLLQSYIKKESEKRREIAPSSTKRTVDVDGWNVVHRLSSGGYADVYMGEKEKGEKAAIKVLRQARLSALERETEYLQALEHPAIVRFIEATQTTDGQPCLIMEYIEGETLAAFCQASNRLSSKEVATIARLLLDALEYMHPKERASSFGDELSADEFDVWKRQRIGTIHRDIKPQNVVLRRDGGPVLIDFNIAVRAMDPVLTTSGTAGYLPPNFNGISWTPAVDLFQLGITLLQVSAAMEYSGTNTEDLFAAARSIRPLAMCSWLEELVDCQYSNASDARRALVSNVAPVLSR